MDRDNKIMEESLNFKKIRKGTILKGEVVSSYKDEVVVNINYLSGDISQSSVPIRMKNLRL